MGPAEAVTINRAGETSESTMTPIAKYILSLALATFPPGRSSISLEKVPDCGSDPKVPACMVDMVCPDGMKACAMPKDEGEQCCSPLKWVDGVGWARTETREAGARRLEVAMQALADAAEHHGAGWGPGPKDLARAMLAAAGWSTGLKEGIQTGRVRGPAGEVCLMDLQLPTLRTLVPWDLARLPNEELAQKVVGVEYPEARRCFDAGALLLVRVRREAERRCKGHPLDYATFALYATGDRCTTAMMPYRDKKTAELKHGDWLAGPRTTSLLKWRATPVVAWPNWYEGAGRTDSKISLN